MDMRIASITLYVRDEDEALEFYTEKLGFEKRMDVPVKPGTRWITVGPKGQDLDIVLHKPSGWHDEATAEKLNTLIGKNPSIVLQTDDCRRMYEMLQNRGVHVVRDPIDQMYGVEAIFEDLYGNSFVLVEPKAFS